MNYNLYVKEHNITGLKYLGQTTEDPYHYRGSGSYWKNHLKKHGGFSKVSHANYISTYIIGTYDNKKELERNGLDFSKAWSIVESNNWANLKEEAGDGGKLSEETKQKMRKPKSEATKQKMKGNQNSLGYKHSTETNLKKSQARKGKPSNHLGHKLSAETKLKISLANKGKQHRLGQKHSEESKQKMKRNKNALGHKCSDEIKLKMSLARKGKPAWNKGKRFPRK